MSLWKSSLPCILTSANPETALLAISQAGIQLKNIRAKGDLTVEFEIRPGGRKTLEEICKKRGDSLRLGREQGMCSLGKKCMHRPFLLAGALFFLTLTLYLPTRVLFVEVEGNETLPDRMILSAAEDCGIRFGVSRREVRSEKMKNALLSAMPELKWAGINTSGCTAVISVREREPQTNLPVSRGVSSIAACRDGFITSCTVTRGNPLCAPGQVVQEGQVLISGYTDLGLCIQVTEAQGEVFAETRHCLTTKTPAICRSRLAKQDTLKRFSLILGKKRINFWKGSGISDPTCGRMYAEYYITLPGGFRLPIAICVETLAQWEISEQSVLSDEAEQSMKDFARTAVLKETVAGRILGEEQIFSQMGDGLVLNSRFLCEEMIGRVITEEIGETNGKTD